MGAVGETSFGLILVSDAATATFSETALRGVAGDSRRALGVCGFTLTLGSDRDFGAARSAGIVAAGVRSDVFCSRIASEGALESAESCVNVSAICLTCPAGL